MRRRTVGMVLIEALGIREALRVQVTCTLWAMFVALEGRAPTKAEFHEAFGQDDATVYRRLQGWNAAFPKGPTLPEFAQQIADRREGKVTARDIGQMEIA